ALRPPRVRPTGASPWRRRSGRPRRKTPRRGPRRRASRGSCCGRPCPRPAVSRTSSWSGSQISSRRRSVTTSTRPARTSSSGAAPCSSASTSTDNAMGSLFASMGDREWLYKGQADFVLLLDAGIKDSFPGQLLWTAEHHEFEQMVLTSYERAFDENRFGPALSETVKDKIQGPKSKKKVWNALDAGRKLALAEGTASLEA
ncbi:unnamed protein product, partial [Prorocentrum cordatum]